MNKPKTVDTYYCDYCGNECEYTPDFVLPVLEEEKYYVTKRGVKLFEFSKGEKFVHKQVDICPECQYKISKLLTLLPKMSFLNGELFTIKIPHK